MMGGALVTMCPWGKREKGIRVRWSKSVTNSPPKATQGPLAVVEETERVYSQHTTLTWRGGQGGGKQAMSWLEDPHWRVPDGNGSHASYSL
jgi:hypothetical protein